MKRIEKTNELLWILGTVLVALGVSICGKADLGVSMIAAPAFVVSEALISSLGSFFSVGVTEYILQGILLITLCILIRKFNWRYLLSFAVAIIYGYTLNLFLWLWGDVQITAIPLRWLMLLIGDCVTAIGVACFFRTSIPLTVYELFVSEFSKSFKSTISKTKWCFDMALLIISILLAILLFGDITSFDWSTIYSSSFHSIGLGTIVTTAINSPLINFMGKLLDKIFIPTPMFKKTNELLKIK